MCYKAFLSRTIVFLFLFSVLWHIRLEEKTVWWSCDMCAHVCGFHVCLRTFICRNSVLYRSHGLVLWTWRWQSVPSVQIQTQEQFLPSGNPSHEHLTLSVEPTTLLCIIYSSRILIFSFQICTYQTCTHIIVCIIFCVFASLYIAYLYISILLFYYLCPVLSCHCHSVALWRFCHYNKSSYVQTYLANKAHSLSCSFLESISPQFLAEIT